MKVWISKYALSKGVYETNAESCFNMAVGLIKVGYAHFHKEGMDWHRDQHSALIRAENMRTNRIASLRKQIAKLENMRFNADKKGDL